MKNINYYVIGGQYQSYCPGGAETLRGAMQLATKSREYWDNFEGWHVPSVYKAEDTVEVTNFFGAQRAPKEGAQPVRVGRWINGKTLWSTPEVE